MVKRFEGKRVLLTGVSRGIGAAIAYLLQQEGASVAVGARHLESIDQVRKRHSHDYIAVPGNLNSPTTCHNVVNSAITQLGGLDILINNAGIFEEVPIENVTQTHWNETIAVNLSSVFFCCQAALPTLINSAGNIVNIASDAALLAYSPAPVYGVTKAGVVNLTQTLAYTYAKQIRVNCVCPGNVETELLREVAQRTADPQAWLVAARKRAPSGRIAKPEEIAEAVAYLASDTAAFTTGVVLPIDGGGVLGFD